MKPLYKDPIVEEIRRRSRALAARFDFDIDRLCEYLHQREQESGVRLVDLSASARKKAKPTARKRSQKRSSNGVTPASVPRAASPKRPGAAKSVQRLVTATKQAWR